jgi:Zn-dependent peptidase ImmA (M78 family)
LFAYDEKLGPCILLNANHPKERRTQSAAHGCGHFISTRNQPEVLHTNEAINSREERYADAFGRAFLTPPRTVRQKFQEFTAGSNQLTRRHVILLAHFFGVSREAIVRRLEELGLAKPGTWDWFEANGKITKENVLQVLGDLVTPDAQKIEANQPTTLRLNLLAAEAYRQELLSEGQLARLLDLDRIKLREIIDGLETERSEADAAPNLPD